MSVRTPSGARPRSAVSHRTKGASSGLQKSPDHASIMSRALPTTVAAALLVLIGIAPAEPNERLVTVSILGLIVSGAVWTISGGPEITAGGVLSIAAALFGYFPALYYANIGSFSPMMPRATWLILAVQLGTMLLLSGSRIKRPPSIDPSRDLSQTDVRRCFGFGLVFLAAGSATSISFGLGSNSVPGAVAFLGAALIMYGSIFSAETLRLRAVLASMAAVALYMGLLFTTGGRLVIAALVFFGVVLALQRVKGRALKAAFMLSLVPALLLAARQRSSVISSTRGVEETGLESVVWPLDRLSTLLTLSSSGKLPPSGGDTFVATLFFWVPRQLWPNKPDGFGTQLVPVLKPHLIGTGHSEAATALGEWVWNFGTVGLVFLPLFTAVLLVTICAWRRTLNAPTHSSRRVFSHIAFALVTSGMLDLFWVGTFGFASRTGLRLIALLLLFLLYKMTPRWRPEQTSKPIEARLKTKPLDHGDALRRPKRVRPVT